MELRYAASSGRDASSISVWKQTGACGFCSDVTVATRAGLLIEASLLRQQLSNQREGK